MLASPPRAWAPSLTAHPVLHGATHLDSKLSQILCACTDNGNVVSFFVSQRRCQLHADPGRLERCDHGFRVHTDHRAAAGAVGDHRALGDAFPVGYTSHCVIGALRTIVYKRGAGAAGLEKAA